MAQYDDDIVFLSKDGGIVSGRQAIGDMFTKALQPPAKGGQCGTKLIAEKTIVVGNTVNVIWRCEAPFFASSPTVDRKPLRRAMDYWRRRLPRGTRARSK